MSCNSDNGGDLKNELLEELLHRPEILVRTVARTSSSSTIFIPYLPFYDRYKELISNCENIDIDDADYISRLETATASFVNKHYQDLLINWITCKISRIYFYVGNPIGFIRESLDDDDEKMIWPEDDLIVFIDEQLQIYDRLINLLGINACNCSNPNAFAIWIHNSVNALGSKWIVNEIERELNKHDDDRENEEYIFDPVSSLNEDITDSECRLICNLYYLFMKQT